MKAITPGQRTQLAIQALGWQGGTVHQVANVFGVINAQNLINKGL